MARAATLARAVQFKGYPDERLLVRLSLPRVILLLGLRGGFCYPREIAVDMSKLNLLFGFLLVSCFAIAGCGSAPEMVEAEPQTEQDLEDYEAEMDATDEIER